MNFKFFLSSVFCFLGLVAGAEIFQLPPKQVANKLLEFIKNGTINHKTLVVWDIDNTLIQDGSDFTIDGAIPINPSFSEIIRETQNRGITHVALTAASPYRTEFSWNFNGSLMATSNGAILKLDRNQNKIDPQNCCPAYFHKKYLKNKIHTVSCEFVRIEGLKHIGIDFNTPKFSFLPEILDIVKYKYVDQEDPIINIVSTQTNVDNWTNPFTKEEYRHVTLDIAQDSRKRHFIQIGNNLEEIICSPIFSRGIIFSNFINFYVHCKFGHIKGNILAIFLKLIEEELGQNFSNIVFIDDSINCVKNVFLVMKNLEKPCTAIQILSEKNEE